MTAKISQHVVNRHHPTRQRGSVNSTTLTIMFAIVLTSSIAFLGFIYLGQVLGTVSEGTDIQKLEQNIVDLNERQRQLELESARLRSIETIEQNIPDLSLVPASNVTYLTTAGGPVAFLGQP